MKKSILIIALSFILFTCSKNDPSPHTAGQCLITGYSKTGSYADPTDPYTYVTTVTVTYNAQNLISGYSMITNYQYTSGTKVNNSTTHTYEYDGNGFLIAETNEFTSDRNGNSKITNAYNYEYKNNVLTKSTQKNTTVNGSATATTFTQVFTYEYNSAGKISKMLSNRTFSSGAPETYTVSYEYNNGALSKVTQDDGTSSAFSLVEVNNQGLITKETFDSNENRYQYDTEGNLLRLEGWLSSKKTSTYTYEYDTRVNLDRLLRAEMKGWTQTYLHGSYGNSPTHNITKYTSYDGSDAITTNGTNTYEYNVHDYPITVSATTTSKYGNTQSNTTVTYKDCQ